MNIFRLPPERYSELLSFQELTILPDSATSIVIVAEHNNQLVGCWCAITTIHIEPLILGPKAQDGGHTAMKLLAMLLSELAASGVGSFFAFADTESVVNYLQRLGLQPMNSIAFQGTNPLLHQPPSMKEETTVK